MANLFQFAATPPSDGEIRAFIKEDIDGTKIVRALTVDNNSLDGRSIIPTLEDIQSVNFKITSSLEISNFQRLTVAQKPTYFFIDNVDISLAEVSSSLSSSVTFEPFQIRSFLNDDYNALISNASDFRPSTSRYVLERSALDPFPTNFEASQGIEVRNLHLSADNIPTALTSSLNIALNFTGEIASFRNDENVTLTVTRDEILKAVGNLEDMITFGSGGTPSTTITAVLNLVIDKEREFSNPQTFFRPLYHLEWVNGTLKRQDITSFHEVVRSGSAAGTSGAGTSDTFFYSRLQLSLSRSQPAGSVTNTYHIRPRLLEIDSTQDFITLRHNINEPGSNLYQAFPYAIPASVPESNYTATGFSNGRYNGSKTTAQDYGGIEPALTARAITILPLTEGPISSSFNSPNGSYGRSWQNMNFLLSGISGSDGERNEYVQQYEEIAYAGLRDTPDANVGIVGEFYSGSNTINPDLLSTTTDTTFDLNTFGFGDKVSVGDLIQFTSGSGGGAKTEQVQITSKSPKVNTQLGKNFMNVFSVTVLRGQGPSGQINDGHDPAQLELTLKQGDRLIKIEGNKIIPQQQIRAVLKPEKVKDSPEDMVIVETDFKGFIINAYTSGSQDGS